jgi:hypothetical protein
MRRYRLGFLAILLLGGIGARLWLLHLEDSYRDHPYSRIEDGLYVGASVRSPPPGTRAVVNLCGQEDRYQVAACLWEPVFEAGNEPSLDWLARVVAFIDAQRREGRTTYVHCLAGMNRSGAAVTAYLMYTRGWGRDQALAFVQSKRPQIQPNPTLMRLLAEWEASLATRRDGGACDRQPGRSGRCSRVVVTSTKFDPFA